MLFEHVYDKTLAQASYFIGCQAKGEAIVIDAKRDIDDYLKIAKEHNLRITHITETHIHADFLCGSRELAAATGATMYLSAEGGPDWLYNFPHKPLNHRDKIEVGNLTLEVFHTPGHTPESITFLLTDHPSSDSPVIVLTGDTLFVGDIGRPDLLEKAAGIKNTQEKGARDLYKSIQELATFPEHLQVWPGHGAGSACGKALGAVPSSTIGYEKIRNWAFQYEDDEAGFVEYLLDGQPEPPTYFAMMKKLNKEPRTLLTAVPKHPQLSKDKFISAYKSGVRIFDTRNKSAFANGYLPDTVNVQGNNSFATWMGWQMNYEDPFILITDDSKIDELTRKLMRVGLDNIQGYFTDIEGLGIPLETAEVIDIEEFKSYLEKDNVQLLDVRNVSEYNEGHVEGAEHLFVGLLEKNLDQVAKDKTVVIYCQAGDRAAIAYSILKRHGILDVKNFSGGMGEWKSKGNPVVTGSESEALEDNI